MNKNEKKFLFSKAKIEALPIPQEGKRLIVWDTRVRGLALRMTATGAKTYYAVRWFQGKAEWFKLGSYGDLSVEQARKLAESFNSDLAHGKSPAEAKRAGKADPTFGEIFDWWVARMQEKGRSEAYLAESRRMFTKHLGGLKNTPVARITRTDVRRLHDTVGSKHRYLANRLLALVRAVLNEAIRHDKIVGPNPAVGIEAFEEQSRERRLLPGEIASFLEAVDAEPNLAIRDYVLLSLFTGARKANVLAMRWNQLDLAGRVWCIPTTKNGKPQVIPLGAPEIEILNQRSSDRGNSPWVFPGDGRTGHLVEPKEGWRRIKERMGVTDLRLHDLRRTLGSFMGDADVPLNVIGKALNHLSPTTTLIYARLTIDPVRRAKEKAVEAMLGAKWQGEGAEFAAKGSSPEATMDMPAVE